MRTKITLFLIFLNVVLFFFIFGVERKWQTERLAEDARARVLGPEAANIQYVEITGDSLPTPVRLARTGDEWNLSSPYEWPANPHAVSRIVNELQFLEHDTSFAVDNLDATGLSLEDYGLATPNLTVTFRSGNGDNTTTTSLAIGNRTEIGQRLYVLSPDGTEVHVVPDSLANSLSLDLAQLRANACFTIPVFEVRSLNLQNDGPANVRVRLRREGNRWMFESPIVTRASNAVTGTALNAIASLRTTAFLGAPSAQPDLIATAGTDSPSLRITLEGNNRRETLLLGNPLNAAPPADADTPPDEPQEFYAQMEGRDAIFTVTLPQLLASSLRNAQSELRDKAVLDLAGRQIDAVTLTDNRGNEVVLQKIDTSDSAATGVISSWQVLQREADGTLRTEPADASVVEDELLTSLRLLRADSFERDVPTDAELEAWGLTRPVLTVTLSFETEVGSLTAPPDNTLLIGTDQLGENAYAKRQKETFVYGITHAIIETTPVDPLHYRKRLLRELPAGARITGLTLRDLSTSTTLYAHDLAGDETWEAVFSATPEAQRQSLRNLYESLRKVEAQKVVNDEFTDTVLVNGQESPWRFLLSARLSISADENEQEEEFSLFLADRDGGNRQLVGAPTLAVVFEATQPLIDAVWDFSYAERDPGPTELTTPPSAVPEPSL